MIQEELVLDFPGFSMAWIVSVDLDSLVYGLNF